MLRVISRPMTVAAERVKDLNAEDRTTRSTVESSGLGRPRPALSAAWSGGGPPGRRAGRCGRRRRPGQLGGEHLVRRLPVDRRRRTWRVQRLAATSAATVASGDGAISDCGARIRVQATGVGAPALREHRDDGLAGAELGEQLTEVVTATSGRWKPLPSTPWRRRG